MRSGLRRLRKCKMYFSRIIRVVCKRLEMVRRLAQVQMGRSAILACLLQMEPELVCLVLMGRQEKLVRQVERLKGKRQVQMEALSRKEESMEAQLAQMDSL